MSAFWLSSVALPLTSTRWRQWTRSQWQQDTWTRVWSHQMTWTITMKWLNLFKSTSNLFQGTRIPAPPVCSCSLCSVPLLIGTGSWSGTQWPIWVQLLSVTRALWPSVRAPGIYSWCGWVEGPWQPKWSVYCVRAASLRWLCLLQVSWRTDGLCKTFQFHFSLISSIWGLGLTCWMLIQCSVTCMGALCVFECMCL